MGYHQFNYSRAKDQKMRVIALFLFCAFSEAAIAQTSECQSIPKAAARLACYDKVLPPIAQGKSAPKTAADQGKLVDPLSAENARTDAAMKNICRGC
jgi:hypothetical protein